jgi:hypothetical protein
MCGFGWADSGGFDRILNPRLWIFDPFRVLEFGKPPALRWEGGLASELFEKPGKLGASGYMTSRRMRHTLQALGVQRASGAGNGGGGGLFWDLIFLTAKNAKKAKYGGLKPVNGRDRISEHCRIKADAFVFGVERFRDRECVCLGRRGARPTLVARLAWAGLKRAFGP